MSRQWGRTGRAGSSSARSVAAVAWGTQAERNSVSIRFFTPLLPTRQAVPTWTAAYAKAASGGFVRTWRWCTRSQALLVDVPLMVIGGTRGTSDRRPADHEPHGVP